MESSVGFGLFHWGRNDEPVVSVVTKPHCQALAIWVAQRSWKSGNLVPKTAYASHLLRLPAVATWRAT